MEWVQLSLLGLPFVAWPLFLGALGRAWFVPLVPAP